MKGNLLAELGVHILAFIASATATAQATEQPRKSHVLIDGPMDPKGLVREPFGHENICRHGEL